MLTAVVTEQEARLAEQLGELWNAYLELPVERPMDRAEFCNGIHVLQGLVLKRAGRRAINERITNTQQALKD